MTPASAGAFMLAKAQGEDLIYVSDRWKKVVNVYAYPTGERVGRLTGFSAPLGECVDRKGNVWIVDSDKVVEYDTPHRSDRFVKRKRNRMFYKSAQRRSGTHQYEPGATFSLQERAGNAVGLRLSGGAGILLLYV